MYVCFKMHQTLLKYTELAQKKLNLKFKNLLNAHFSVLQCICAHTVNTFFFSDTFADCLGSKVNLLSRSKPLHPLYSLILSCQGRSQVSDVAAISKHIVIM